MGLLPENARHLEQEVRGLLGQNFGAENSIVGVVDEIIEVQKRLRRKWMVQAGNGVTDWHYSRRDYWRVMGVLVAAKEESGMLVGFTGNAVVRGLEREMEGLVHLCVLVAD